MICWVLAMELLQGVWKQHLRPRAVVGYGLKIFLPSPPNYVTRSPGWYGKPEGGNIMARKSLYQIIIWQTQSLCSHWFFLSQDFAVWTVSMEMVQSVYFCFGARPANSTFATKTAKKKVWKLSFFTLKLAAEAKKIEFFPKFQRWLKKTNIF